MKYFVVCVCLLFSISAFAHQDRITLKKKGNVYVEYVTGYDEFEVHQKISHMLYYVDRLIQAKGLADEELYINFQHDYTKRQFPYYALNYGEFTDWYFDSIPDTIKHVPHTGILFSIRDDDFGFREMLNVILCAYRHVEYIKTHQRVYQFQTFWGREEEVSSIPFKDIYACSLLEDAVIDSLLNEKLYRNLKKNMREGDVDYYLQGGKYHFYNTRSPDEEYSEKLRKKVVVKRYGADIFVLDHVLEIVGEYASGPHLVFADESTFYLVPAWYSSPVKGPYVVDSVPKWRRPARNFEYEYEPIERYSFLLYGNSRGQTQEVLLLPDYDLLISGYQNKENQLVGELITSRPGHRRSLSVVERIVVLVIGVSVLVNIGLWSKRS